MSNSIVLPGWGYLFVAASLYLFYATTRSKNLRRAQRRELLKEKQENLLRLLREKSKKDQNDEVSDITKDQ
jgi:hypothetical protein